MNAFKSSKYFILFAVLTAVFCLVSISKRVSIESSNNEYAIAVDSDAIESLAAAQGLTADAAIKKLKETGVNAMVIQEQTVGELIADGRVELTGLTIQPKSPGISAEAGEQNQVKTLTFSDDVTVERVVRGLNIRFGKLVQNSKPRDKRLALPPVDTNSIRGTSIGLDPRMTTLAQKNGLIIIARCSNPVGITSKAVSQTLTWANQLGATVFLAQGEQVLGRRDALKSTSDTLKILKMQYASPEFSKLGGDVEMLAAIPELVVRLHSAQAAELDKLSLDAAVERYRKAGKERNMRILLVRPLSNASDSPLDSLSEFIGAVQSSLQKEGLRVGTPSPYGDPEVSKFVKLAIGLFGGLSAVWVCLQLFRSSAGLYVTAAMGIAILAGTLTSGKGLQISSLLLSMVFPIGSYFWMMRAKQNAVITLLVVFAISMIGGLCVAGLLNGLDYFIRAEAFAGVKLSVFAPIFVIGIVSFAQLNDLKKALKEPITWGAAALGIFILAALGLMVLRTGNDNPNAVSGGEIALRGFLEQLLPVRPRTKDFIVGFPALVIGVSILAKANYSSKNLGKLGGWTSLLLMLGGIGLTDIVNTLCHLHTPVVTSVIRNVEGLVLGAVIGFGLWFLLQKKISLHLNQPETPEVEIG